MKKSFKATFIILSIDNLLNFLIGVSKFGFSLYKLKFQWSNKHSPSAHSNTATKNSFIAKLSISLIKFGFFISLYFFTASFNNVIDSFSEISASTVLAPAILKKYF